jgi:AraC-like DNA-binding protein
LVEGYAKLSTMRRLERTSHDLCVRSASGGRRRHAPRDFLPRHVHEVAFATIVLTGGYVEAGDTGRHRAVPGDVVLHAPYEWHLDRVDFVATEVLVVPLTCGGIDFACGRIADPDSLVRIVESDSAAAEPALFEQLKSRNEPPLDWPDDLARALRDDPSLSLRGWAGEHGLSVGSLSRGFVQVYGVSPASYRLLQRTHRAIRAILKTEMPLSAIAQNAGFADQAHMSRAVQRATALSPRVLRARWPMTLTRQSDGLAADTPSQSPG